MQRLRTVLKWRWIRYLQFWNHATLRAQGGILAAIPIIAVLVSFAVAFYGNRSRSWIEYDIQRKFKMVRQYNDLMTLMVDAETGERGFLLTKRPEYLEPYERAVAGIPSVITSLRENIELEPGENPRLRRLEGLGIIEDLVGKQLASLKASQDYVSGKSADQLYEHLQGGKTLMDAIRTQVGAMQNKEEELLAERIDETNYIRYRDYIFVFVALFAGLVSRIVAFYLFDRGIVRRVNRLTENVALINEGQPAKNPMAKKSDAIGLLEQEIVKIAERRDLQTNDQENI